MNNKKIFFVADAKSIHTAKWIDYFVKQNYEVFLATFANTNNTKCNNIYFLGNEESTINGGNYHYLLSIPKLANIFREIQPDIINAHYSYSMGMIALLAKKRSKVNGELSIVCHGSDVLSPPKPYIFDILNKYLLNKCNKVFVVSDQIKDKVESFGVNIEKIFVGQYGIDMSNIVISKNIDIISNRAYQPNSRIDFLLEGIDEMHLQKQNIIFVVPHIEDSEHKMLIAKYPYIKFYKHIEYSKMIDLVSRAKIYISATKSDGTSLSLLEAMKLDCVPIVSNIVSNRSWILDGVNGYLFNGKSEFQNKLKKALNLNSCESIIDINQSLLRSKGDYNKQMQKIENFLIGNL